MKTIQKTGIQSKIAWNFDHCLNSLRFLFLILESSFVLSPDFSLGSVFFLSAFRARPSLTLYSSGELYWLPTTVPLLREIRDSGRESRVREGLGFAVETNELQLFLKEF